VLGLVIYGRMLRCLPFVCFCLLSDVGANTPDLDSDSYNTLEEEVAVPQRLLPWVVEAGSWHSFKHTMEALGGLVVRLREQLDAVVCMPSPTLKHGEVGSLSGDDEQPLEMAKAMFLRSFHAGLIHALRQRFGKVSGAATFRHELDAEELGQLMGWISAEYATTLGESGWIADDAQSRAWTQLLQEMHSVTETLAGGYSVMLEGCLERAVCEQVPWSYEGQGTGTGKGTTMPVDISSAQKTLCCISLRSDLSQSAHTRHA
jgi:hypothetical protein